jgi:hypothetical protein
LLESFFNSICIFTFHKLSTTIRRMVKVTREILKTCCHSDFLHFSSFLPSFFVFNDKLYPKSLFNSISRHTLVIYGLLTIINSNGFFFFAENKAEVSVKGEFWFHFVCLIVFNAIFNNISVILWRHFTLRRIQVYICT